MGRKKTSSKSGLHKCIKRNIESNLFGSDHPLEVQKEIKEYANARCNIYRMIDCLGSDGHIETQTTKCNEFHRFIGRFMTSVRKYDKLTKYS